MSHIQNKLKELPSDPGVYLYKNEDGEIIYVGKAAVLKNRVRQYFQKSRPFEAKTEALVADIRDVDWITVETELDALFLEAELIRRYMPKYNILLRDDKSSGYIRVTYSSDHPTVTITRRPLDDGAQYFGPYYNVNSIRKALTHLRKAFPFSTHEQSIPKRACLQYHLGLCPGLEENKTSPKDYRENLKKLTKYFKGERKSLIVGVEKSMLQAAKKSKFEEAEKLKKQLFALKGLTRQVVFSDSEFMDLSKDAGLSGLAKLLGLYEDNKPEGMHLDGVQESNEKRLSRTHSTLKKSRSQLPQQSVKSSDSATSYAGGQGRVVRPFRRIEGYDISHMSGTDTVASMVVFTNGLPNKAEYRKFKMRIPGNDDFAHMNEVITRRLSQKNIKQWGLPDLFLIDGGKGQLGAAIKARDEAGLSHIPMIGLAKREEEIIVANSSNFNISLPKNSFVTESDHFAAILLPKNSHIVMLLQRIRDESHRFAVSYHTVLKRTRQTDSVLDDIPGIGPVTKKQLLKSFGSMKRVSEASAEDVEKVVGKRKAVILEQYLLANKKGQL